MHLVVLASCFGGMSLSMKKKMGRLTDQLGMTLKVLPGP